MGQVGDDPKALADAAAFPRLKAAQPKVCAQWPRKSPVSVLDRDHHVAANGNSLAIVFYPLVCDE